MKIKAPARRIAFSAFLVSTALACGSRTGLFGDEDSFGFTSSSGATSTSSSSSGVLIDGSVFYDGGILVPDDARSTIDARPVPPDVYRADCPNSDALLVYVISDDYQLQSFNPENGQFRSVGRINCPAAAGSTPFSMAVDRRGTAFILFTDHQLYRVSTATGACIGTPYVSDQSGFRRFGMGFATNSVGPTEQLFVAGTRQQNGAEGLASIDPSDFRLTVVGNDARLNAAELTGTGDGRLFAFYPDENDDSASFIGEVDTQTGRILGQRRFDSVDQGSAWAFAFWGGDFYMFHAPGQGSTITRWRPADNSVATVATAPPGTFIVGAGVSTCAPQQ